MEGMIMRNLRRLFLFVFLILLTTSTLYSQRYHKAYNGDKLWFFVGWVNKKRFRRIENYKIPSNYKKLSLS